MPDSVAYSFQGTARAFQSSIAGLGMLLLMAVLVIYIVLGILYESFIHPITILSGLPSAGFGALLALWLFHYGAQHGYISRQLDMELNLYGFVGVIMLIGIVKKNAIMMIDFALEAQRNDGKDPAEAIYQGCVVRFRPIMMTTAAALMGILPIAIGHGAGGESQASAGSGGRGRADFLAGRYALPYAGAVHLHGEVPQPCRAPAARAPSRNGRARARPGCPWSGGRRRSGAIAHGAQQLQTIRYRSVQPALDRKYSIGVRRWYRPCPLSPRTIAHLPASL